MANDEHLALLKQGAKAWNAWRVENPGILSDLSNIDLSSAKLAHANLRHTFLNRTNITQASLDYADLRRANLCNADFTGARLIEANLSNASISHTDFAQATFSGTVFGNIDLTEATGLDAGRHISSSIVDHLTLQRSRNLPLNFLRGCGLPERLIDYLSSIFDKAIHFWASGAGHSMLARRAPDAAG